ncbi:MAG TPA: flagellar hook-basal body complex protein FliE [Candidatus Angelobacter sp.]|nr:flagellar hook-basal body complex protein FliE [Candidatus Angelobacter sp.]
MSPLSAIPSSAYSFGVMPGTDAVRPNAMPTPEIQAPTPLQQPGEVTPSQEAGDSFGNVLGKFISDVNAKQNIANTAIDAVQSGQNVPLHQAVIAMEEANVSFQLMVEVRNKLLDSYQELMRMQI